MPAATSTAVTPSALANSIMAKLYDVISNGDDSVPKTEDNFLSWVTPGFPLVAEDFEFLTQGFMGALKRPAVNELISATGGPQPAEGGTGLTPDQINQLLAQDVGRLYMQAESFARMVDFVPDVSGIQGRTNTLNVMNNEGSLSDRYEYILRMTQVAEAVLPEETKKKIEKFRALLTVKTQKKDLFDDTKIIEGEEPSPLSKAYFEKMKAYEDAALDYNARRIDALAGTDPKAVQYWSINANILRNRVKAALADWISNGYKNEYEQIAAFIAQVTERDMTLLKAHYKDALDKARLTGLASGGDFYYTSLAPANWVKSAGWTEFSFASGDMRRYEKSSSNKWSAGGSFLGLVSVGASGSKHDSKTTFDSSRFGLRFKITQVPIITSNWLKSAFLVSKSMRFDQNSEEAKGQMISDGGNPPKGLIPAYPTSMIVVKDLELQTSDVSSLSEFHSSAVKGGGMASFGPFTIGGSYQHGKSSRKFESSFDSKGMRIPGMQAVAFKCHVNPKAPNPLATIKKWV